MPTYIDNTGHFPIRTLSQTEVGPASKAIVSTFGRLHDGYVTSFATKNEVMRFFENYHFSQDNGENKILLHAEFTLSQRALSMIWTGDSPYVGCIQRMNTQ